MSKDKSEIGQLIGKTISIVEVIKAEYGRTYSTYFCITCSDGTKLMLASAGSGTPWNPNPAVEEMRKAPSFFSAEDIANEVLIMEKKSRKEAANRIQRKRHELEALKKELGEE